MKSFAKFGCLSIIILIAIVFFVGKDAVKKEREKQSVAAELTDAITPVMTIEKCINAPMSTLDESVGKGEISESGMFSTYTHQGWEIVIPRDQSVLRRFSVTASEKTPNLQSLAANLGFQKKNGWKHLAEFDVNRAANRHVQELRMIKDGVGIISIKGDSEFANFELTHWD